MESSKNESQEAVSFDARMPTLNHKNVNDLIKEKVKMANKLKKEFEKSDEYTNLKATKKEEDEEESPILHPYINMPGFETPLTLWQSYKTNKFIEDNENMDEFYDNNRNNDIEEESILSNICKEAWDSIKDRNISELLKEKMDYAASQISEMKEIVTNPVTLKEAKSRKIPIGFEHVKDDEKGPYFNEILEFLNPFLSEILGKKITGGFGLDVVLKRITHHFEQYSEQKQRLQEIMNVKKFIVPYISLDLPGDIILAYNKMEEYDPLVAVFRLHPIIGEEIWKFGIFLDRYDTNKEAICSLVWSTIDNMVINLPMVGLNPYPRCWNCEKSFGTMACAKCGVAKYCSKECQVASWKKNHRLRCKEIEFYASLHKCLVFP